MNAKTYFLTEKEKADVLSMALSGEILNKDIAAKFGRRPSAVSYCLRKLGVRNTAKDKVMGKWNIKHAHLRESAMRYFVTHTAEETEKKFKLTHSEFKSLMTYGYRDKTLLHVRKDKRRHDSWTAYEFKFLLQHSGLMPREWIAKKLKRGGLEAIRGKLEQLSIASKSVNGLTLSQFREAFNKEPDFYLQTKAGPGQGKYNATYFKIIPWVWLDQELKAKRLKTHKIFRKLIASMALFQEWFFDGDALIKMQRICK